MKQKLFNERLTQTELQNRLETIMTCCEEVKVVVRVSEFKQISEYNELKADYIIIITTL
jgi:hypothetical protein